MLTKEHKERIGEALWVFLWCIDKTTKEYDAEGTLRGLVLGGKPIKAAEIAEDLGGSKKQIERTLQKLADEGYISLKRAPYGQIIEVLKSKKFAKRRDMQVPSGEDMDVPSQPEREDTDVLSDGQRGDTDVPSGQDKNVLSDEREDINVPSRTNTDVPSNKTLQLDLARKEKEAAAKAALGIVDPGPEFDGIADYVMVSLGKGRLSEKETKLIKALLLDGIPVNTILETFDEKLAEYARDNVGQYFNSFCYCEKPIRNKHELNTKAAHLQLVQGYAQTAATQSPGDELESDFDKQLRRLLS